MEESGSNFLHELIEQDLAVRIGANVQPGQLLVVTSSVTNYEFVRMCVKEAYEAGAGDVVVNWSDEQLALMSYTYCSLETLTEFPQWTYDKQAWAQEKGCCFLHITSNTPGLMKDVDPEKMQAVQIGNVEDAEIFRLLWQGGNGDGFLFQADPAVIDNVEKNGDQYKKHHQNQQSGQAGVLFSFFRKNGIPVFRHKELLSRVS